MFDSIVGFLITVLVLFVVVVLVLAVIGNAPAQQAVTTTCKAVTGICK